MSSFTKRKHFRRIMLLLFLCVVAAAFGGCPELTCAQEATETTTLSSDGSPLGLYGTDVTSSLSVRAGANKTLPAPLTASLLAEPMSGAAPLTVDFSIILPNPQSPLVYQWDFGDGAVSSLPAGTYVPHVYQRPGTYFCSLTLMNAQETSTIVVTIVTVLAHQN
jgi:PKD repeat protein